MKPSLLRKGMLLIIALLLVLVFSCQRQPAIEKVTASVGGLTFEAGIYVAMEKGYFKQQGIEMELVRGASSDENVAMLAGGHIDMANMSPSAIMFAVASRGIGIRVIADQGKMTKGHATAGLVVRKDLWDGGKIRSIADLKGKTVALATATCVGHIQLDTALQKAGLSIKDVNEVYVHPWQMIPALTNKSVDAALPYDPFTWIAVWQGAGHMLATADEMYPDAQVAVWITTPQFIQQRPEVLKRWMVAYIKGVRDYTDAWHKNKDKEEIIEILMKHTVLKDKSLYEKLNWVNMDPDGRVNVKSLEEEQDWYAKNYMLKQKTNLAEMVDMKFVDHAVEQLGKYRW